MKKMTSQTEVFIICARIPTITGQVFSATD